MLAELISLENGKALPDATGEVTYAAEFFRWFSEEAVRLNGELAVAPGGANRILVQYQPIGVAVMVTPWNFPAAMATRKLGPALAAGCTCVLKPAGETPLTAYVLAEHPRRGGRARRRRQRRSPPRRSGATVGAMLHDPRVRKLSFTGSTEVGRVLLKEAADQVLSCSMELGGNAPFVVFDDADLDAALDGAMIAKMRNGGEACTAANRFYVQAGIAEAFSARPRRAHGGDAGRPGLRPGDQRSARWSTRDAVDPHRRPRRRRRRPRRDAALRRQAARPRRLLLPADRARPASPPTPRSAARRSSARSPRSPPSRPRTRPSPLANDTEFGLIAYVYTGDLARGLRVSERIEAGMVGLNRGLVSDPAAPFGGVKQCGLGREGAHHGILEFCETKYIAASW